MDYSKEQYYRMQQMLANQAYGAGECGMKKPFYMTYPVQSLYMTELEYERDMERMKELYPSEAKKILEYVEDECDRMEYEGSMMFDENPDRLMLRRICDRIYGKIAEPQMPQVPRMPQEPQMPRMPQMPQMHREENMETGGDMVGMDRRPSQGRRGDDGLRNLIEVLLYNEMYKRRCRYKRCRRWW